MFVLREGVTFHDGTPLKASDVKFTFERLVDPATASPGASELASMKSIEVNDDRTVVMTLNAPDASLLAALAGGTCVIFSEAFVKANNNDVSQVAMGTGPFKFVEYVRGSHWVGKKNPDYWDKGKPYLDGYRAIFISSSSAQVAAVRGERAMIQFRSFSPAERDQLVQALGNKLTVQESPWDCLNFVSMHHEKKPFDDKRVRRALTLALDRWEGSKALSRIALIKEVAGIQVPGTPWATPPAELEKLAGYGRDINAARAEARRLLKEAGAENLSFTLLNRAVPQPYEPFGIWLIDQWRQIGLNVKIETIEASAYHPMLKRGDFGARERGERVQRYLAMVGLTDFAGHRPNQLSGGQRQRVAIARALVNQPRIVLADEPTANLDHKTGNRILQLMKKINRRTGTTFVFSTHDQKVLDMADRRVDLEDGAIVRLGIHANGRWLFATGRKSDAKEPSTSSAERDGDSVG